MDYIIENPIKTAITGIVLYNLCFGVVNLRYGYKSGVSRSFKLQLPNIVNTSRPFYSTNIIDHPNTTKTSITYTINERFLHNLIRFQPIINKDIKTTTI
jgi:hypothetical protein